MGRPKKLVTKAPAKKSGPLHRFVEEKEIPLRQIYARVRADKADKFVQILESEGLSIYQGIEIAISMLIDYYSKKTK